MSHRLKSDVRRVEKSDSRQNREEDERHHEQVIESERRKKSNESKRRETVHRVDKNSERFYHEDHADNRRRRNRSDEETTESRKSRRRDGDVVRERSRHSQDEHDDRKQHTNTRSDDRHPANSTSKRHAENEQHKYTETKNEEAEDEKYMKAKRAKVEDTLTTRTGGAYIPPARLRMMQDQISDKASIQYQRLSWEALKKSINGLINKANVSNLVHIVRELFQENIVRGRGLLARSIMQAQAASPTFTHVYAALVAIINTKFPQIGELIVKRLIIQFRKGYRRSDKSLCMSASRFIAHLVNQRVAHEVLALEVMHVLMENPTNDSIELAVAFLKECGQRLTEVSPRGITGINVTFTLADAERLMKAARGVYNNLGVASVHLDYDQC